MPDYWEKTVEYHSDCDKKLASYTPGITPKRAYSKLIQADWELFESPHVEAPASCFVTHDIKGRYGMVKLDDLPEDHLLMWDDGKETGFASFYLQEQDVPSNLLVDIEDQPTYIIIVLHNETNEPMAVTYHPGKPSAKSTLKTDTVDKLVYSVAEVKELGFTEIKIKWD
jgi:hypothetical protein